MSLRDLKFVQVEARSPGRFYQESPMLPTSINLGFHAKSVRVLCVIEKTAILLIKNDLRNYFTQKAMIWRYCKCEGASHKKSHYRRILELNIEFNLYLYWIKKIDYVYTIDIREKI